MDVRQQRAEHVAETMRAVKQICESCETITRDTLKAVEEKLKTLAARRDLFPHDEFGIAPDEKIRLYRLAEDEGATYALYYHRANVPASVPPHNHTTWACIAGIAGVEENTFYKAPHGSAPVVTGTRSIGAGDTISLMPDDIHSIEATGSEPLANLHLYGLALDKLYDRVFWNRQTGSWEKTAPTSGIIERRA